MANLLERSSLVLTPTAYNNGEALCIKPDDASGDFQFSRNSAATRVNAQGLVENVQILSSNLVQNPSFSEEGVQEITNGDFSNGSTGWSVGTGITISSQANFTSVSGSYITQNILTAGKTYKLTFNITEYTSGTLIVFGGAGNNIGSSLSLNAVGSYTTYFVAGGFDSKIYFGNVFTGSITNISVKEVGQNWSVTNTDADNYVEFGDGTARLKFLNTSPLTELATNFVVTAGKKYKLTVDVATATSGGIKIDGNGISETFNTSGISTRTINPTAATAIKFYRATANVDITLNSVSLIEITTDTNLPRINYENFSFDGSGNIIPDSGCGSWLFEPQSTNLITYSEDFSQWNKGADITIEGGYLAPDGNNTAYKITKTGGGAPYLTDNIGLTATTTRSIYARTVSGTGTATLLSHNSNTNNTFTLTEQWQRFELSDTASSSGLTSFYAADFRGSGTLTEYLVWGANATNDQDYATSYIPSNGSQVTRNQDVCLNGGSLASINSTEGVLYAEIRKDVSQTTFRLISLNNAASNSDANSVAIGYANGGSDFYLRVKSPSGGFTSQNIPASNNEFHKIAIRYEQANIGIFIDGIKEVTYTGNYLFTQPLDNLSFDYNGNGGLPFFGKTKALAVWKEALSDAELTALTTI